MKHLWVLNPNSTAWMTERVVQQVRLLLPKHLQEQVQVQGLTAQDGPPVIASRESFDVGAAVAVQTLQAALAGAVHAPPDAVLLACFGDPGLEALRAAAPGLPVRGLAQAAMAQAVAQGRRFAILTSGADWVALLQQRAADFGFAAWLTGVHALPVDGRVLAQAPQRWRAELQAAADAAQAQGAQTLILGGAAFAGLGALVQTPLPVIDGITAATAALLPSLRH